MSLDDQAVIKIKVSVTEDFQAQSLAAKLHLIAPARGAVKFEEF